MLRYAPSITDNQRNARVMWKQNDTHRFAKQILSQQDEQFVRKEARLIDASGAAQKTRSEQNEAWEHRAENNRVKKVRIGERKAATKRRLAGVQILDGLSIEGLMKLKRPDLDAQIDKLRELGDKELPAKSTLGNKNAKAQAIFEALHRRHSLVSEGDGEDAEISEVCSNGDILEGQSDEEYPDEHMDLDPNWVY